MLLLQLFPCSANVEYNCCLLGIDLRVGGAVYRCIGKKSAVSPLCVWNNSSNTHLLVSLLWYFAWCVVCLQWGITTSLSHAGRRQLPACQRKVSELFFHTAAAWRSNACQSASQLPGMSLAVDFPGKIFQQWGGRRAELSIRVEQWCTSSWAFNSHRQSPLPTRVLRGNLWEIPVWT